MGIKNIIGNLTVDGNLAVNNELTVNGSQVVTSAAANMQVATSPSEFNSLLSSENIGKAVSYDNNLYIIGTGAGAKEIEVGDTLSTIYFDTSTEPDLAALSYNVDGAVDILYGIDSGASQRRFVVGAIRWDDLNMGVSGYGLVGYSSSDATMTVIYSTVAFTVSLFDFAVSKGWNTATLSLSPAVSITEYDPESKSILGHILSSAAISSDTLVAISMLKHEEDPTVPAWAKQSSKPTYTYSEITDKPTINGVELTDTMLSADLKLGLVTNSGGFQAGTSAKTFSGGAVGSKAKATDGGAVGEEAFATTGGAVGLKAKATDGGGAIGDQANTAWGGAVGKEASAYHGGAVGSGASAHYGGAVGNFASAFDGFAGGDQAKARYAADDATELSGAVAIGARAIVQVNDAVQLGTGTNTNEGTLQFREYQLLNADGKIPADRLPAADTSLGGVKSGGDVTIADGVITVSDDSHNHVISNIDGLQSALDRKQNIINSSNKLAVSNISGLADVATSGSYTDLSNKPIIPTVNDATLTIQQNSTSVGTFTANASSDITVNITVPTKTSDLGNDSGFITNIGHKTFYRGTESAQNTVEIQSSDYDALSIKSIGQADNYTAVSNGYVWLQANENDAARLGATDLMYWTGEGDAAVSGTIPWSSLAFLKADAGQVGQVLTSAGPNTAPYWSSDYVSLLAVLPYLASFAPGVDYTSVTQLYKILGVETELDASDYDMSDTKEVGGDPIDSSAVFYTPGTNWPSDLGTPFELEQRLKTKPCIIIDSRHTDWKGSILAYRESTQADYGFGTQLYDLWDKYDYSSSDAAWSHDNTSSSGGVTIATNSIVTNPIYKQPRSTFAYDSSTKILTIS